MPETAATPDYPSEEELRAQWRASEASRIIRDASGRYAGWRLLATILLFVPGMLATGLLENYLHVRGYLDWITFSGGSAGDNSLLRTMVGTVLIGLPVAVLPFMYVIGVINERAMARASQGLESAGLVTATE